MRASFPIRFFTAVACLLGRTAPAAPAEAAGGADGQRCLLFAAGDGLRYAVTDPSLAGGEQWLEVVGGGWRTPGQWMGTQGRFDREDGAAGEDRPEAGPIRGRLAAPVGDDDEIACDIRAAADPQDPKTWIFECQTRADREVEFHQFVLVLRPGGRHRGPGQGTLSGAGGDLEINPDAVARGYHRGLRRYVLRDREGTPGADIRFLDGEGATGHSEGNHFHLVLAEGRLAAGETRQTRFSVTLPFEVAGAYGSDPFPQPAGLDRWFEWDAESDTAGASVIDASGLLDAPAGRLGRIRAEGDFLTYGGRPLKLWGVNNCYGAIYPERSMADRRAAFYAKYGLNAVRLHKWADAPGWGGIQTHASAVRWDEDLAERMDYYVAALKARGLYVVLSANFGNIRLGPDDLARVPGIESFGHFDNIGLCATPHASLWLSAEVQDLQIEQLCNLLRRTSTASGLAYAEDPCVAAVELVNENDAFWYSTWGEASANPFLRRLAGEQFTEWLRGKYGSEAALLAAWGDVNYGGLEDLATEGESWDMVYPAGNAWFWDDANVTDGRRPRLLDAALFWYGRQNAFYARFAEAIRETGYDGEILASNWQAGSGYAHYLNLHSDSLVGLVDRHNYYGSADAMLSAPGSGILSTGMNQQVAGRPFMISEWAHASQNEVSGEGPALVGAYGMGLNGWDGSFLFQNGDEGRFSGGLWGGPLDPPVFALMPAVSRMVLRHDVAESELRFTRHVDLPSLWRGRLGFRDDLSQGYDDKSFGSPTLSPALLAVGRMVVEFGGEPRPTEPAVPSNWMEGGAFASSTGQLRWRPGRSGRDGHVTVDTPRTQAVVGFTRGVPSVLSAVTVTVRTPFASVYVTSLDDGAGVDGAGRLLVTALARVRNTGMDAVAGQTVRHGQPPMRVEPVEATLEFRRGGDPEVRVLDLDGRRTGRTLPAPGGRLVLDTGETRAIYYEVVYGG